MPPIFARRIRATPFSWPEDLLFCSQQFPQDYDSRYVGKGYQGQPLEIEDIDKIFHQPTNQPL